MMGEERVSVRLRLFSRRSTDRYGPCQIVPDCTQNPQKSTFRGSKKSKNPKVVKIKVQTSLWGPGPMLGWNMGTEVEKKGPPPPPPLAKTQLNVIDYI